MTEQELHQYLFSQYPYENECCEWKAFSNLKSDVSGRKGEDIISYISAIANMEGGHLIIGIEDKSLKILGINHFHDYTPENLPYRILGNCTYLPSEGLKVENFVTSDSKKIVWIIHIPKHAARQPVVAHKTAWQRSGDSLVELTESRKDKILNEPLYKSIGDWSAEVCPNASLQELDESAILKARKNYSIKNPRLSNELKNWDDQAFLTKTKLITHGKITRTAILLLGKPESTFHLGIIQPQISWVLYSREKIEKDYHHFEPPYILAVDELYQKIRNLKYRYLKDGTLFPEEIDQYDASNIREALSNCIAHMDYSMGGRISVSENEDGYISFTNPGSFLPGNVEDLLKYEDPPAFYRNHLLAKTMESFNMIDSIGSGIKRMFRLQRERYFPMPDFDLSNNKVKVTLIGKVLDIDYARVLASNPKLSLDEIILLDKVQKRQLLKDDELKILRAKQLVEGKKPNIIISANIAQVTGQKAKYTRNKAFNKQQYFDWIIQGIKDHGSLSRTDIEQLVWDRLSDLYSFNQKKIKINNLISDLRKMGKIQNIGSDTKPQWVLIEKL